MDDKWTDYVLKHSRRRTEELRYDFMPSMLELIERPAHRAGTVIIFAAASLLFAALLWAAFSKVDTVVSANGVVQAEGGMYVVKAGVGGQIKNVLVKEGQHVAAGDLLIEIDNASAAVEETRLLTVKKQLQAQCDIYKKLQNAAQSSIEIDVNQEAQRYEEALHPYVYATLALYESHLYAVQQINKEIELQQLNKEEAEQQLRFYEQSGFDSQIQQQKRILRQSEAELEKQELALKNTNAAYTAQLCGKLAEAESSLIQAQTELERIALDKKNRSVLAGLDGFVNQISVKESEAVGAAQELLVLVPDAANGRIMQCYVGNADIAEIHIGMEAKVKFSAYRDSKNGTVSGTVSYISAGAFGDEKLGNVYLVKITLQDVPEEIELLSGLQGNVEFQTGKRSILQYFLDPITKGMSESMKER